MDVTLVIDPAVLGSGHSISRGPPDKCPRSIWQPVLQRPHPGGPSAPMSSAFSSAIERSPVGPNPHAARTRPTVRTRQKSLNPERLNDQCQYCPE